MEEQVVEKKVNNNKKYARSTTPISKEGRKKMLTDLARVNKKGVGRKVRSIAYLDKAIKLMTSVQLKELEQESLTHTDRFELDYREYVAKHGAITKDAYLGKRLFGEQPDPSKLSPVAGLQTSESMN